MKQADYKSRKIMIENKLRAGAAAVDITPQGKITLAGSLTRRYAEGVIDALHARAIVIDNGKTKIVFVLIDLIAFGHEDCDDVRRGIASELDIPISNVCVSCTHTHYAPGNKEGFETPREGEYLDWAKPRMIEAAVTAAKSLAPAQAAWGIGHEGRPQYNRRYHMRDGSVRFNPGDPANAMKPAGPTDPELPLLLLRRADNKEAIAVLANYSLHYIGDHDGNKICSDYFGEFSRLAKERFGDSCVALLTHGASGDINNSNHQKLPEPWYPAEMKPRERSGIIAGMLLDQVQKIWDAAEWHDEAALAATQDIYDLKVRKISGDEIEKAKREEADESMGTISRHYATERLKLLEFPDTLPQVVSSLRVGDYAASTLTGEIFCQFGLDVKHASPFPVTALIELANGYGGYTPTRYSYALGAYETWLARSAYAAPGSGEEMIAIAARQLHDLWLENDDEKIEAARVTSHDPFWGR
jgi:hypothetical protein